VVHRVDAGERKSGVLGLLAGQANAGCVVFG
jgi:hypothetical protein